jgi:hypothetical protein
MAFRDGADRLPSLCTRFFVSRIHSLIGCVDSFTHNLQKDID